MIVLSILSGSFSGRYRSLLVDLCPCAFPNILIPPSVSCVVLVSGLYRTDVIIRFAFVFFLILQGVCHRSCLWGVSLFGFHLSLTLFSSSLALFLQSLFRCSLPLHGVWLAVADILIRSPIVLALWLSCKHFMVFDLVRKFLFFAIHQYIC